MRCVTTKLQTGKKAEAMFGIHKLPLFLNFPTTTGTARGHRDYFAATSRSPLNGVIPGSSHSVHIESILL